MIANSSEITFVCCIESGSLESYTVRMLKSLRRWGGYYSDAPIIAVTPRFGPPLSRETLQLFKALNITYLRSNVKNRYSWFNFLNKPLSLKLAEDYITTESVCWMDSDLLILDEPEKLKLLPSEDFLGFPVECQEMGTTGPGDPYEPIWQEFCHVVDIDIEKLPWVITAETNQRVRLYFNGGIFVYRRSTQFAQSYLDICLKLLDSGICTGAKGYSDGLKEMIAIGFSVIKMGLIWKPLPYSHDYVMSSMTHDDWYKEEMLRAAKIIHYHDSMWPSFWPTLIESLQKTHPEVAAWLKKQGPMRNEAPWQWRLIGKSLKKWRLYQATQYRASCTIV